MSTRASQAGATSRQVKHELVRLLFGRSLVGKGPDAHRKLDPTIYSFAQLRKAYLDRVHEIHPDKHKHHHQKQVTTTATIAGAETVHNNQSNNNQNNNNNNNSNQNYQSRSTHTEFIQLQEAWDKYEQIAKTMQHLHPYQRTRHATMDDANAKNANFTMFGVGCSFSDTPAERMKRDEIMDQACRGWFSAGAIPESTTSPEPSSLPKTPLISLCDDDMFVEYNNNNNNDDDHHDSEQRTNSIHNKNANNSKPKPSLIPEGYRRRDEKETVPR